MHCGVGNAIKSEKGGPWHDSSGSQSDDGVHGGWRGLSAISEVTMVWRGQQGLSP